MAVPTPFHFTYDSSLSVQQAQWTKDALSRCRFAINRGSADVTFVAVEEPVCEGHKDYMCTHAAEGGGGWTVEIRSNADDPRGPAVVGLPNPVRDVKNFFMESIIHEVIGHVFFFEHFNDDASRLEFAGMFTRPGATGAGERVGTLDDWNPVDKPWEDRIQEALAEFAKDVYMPPAARIYDNRTNWAMKSSSFSRWLTMVETIICPPEESDT